MEVRPRDALEEANMVVQTRESMGSVNLTLLFDPKLLQAAGTAALAHGQLELMLRMTIKVLAGLTVREALDATREYKNWQLHKEIVSLFNGKTRDASLRLKLKSILGRCKRLSDERNTLLHNAWGIDPDGSVVTKGSDHVWGKAPEQSDLKELAEEIQSVVNILDEERRTGFIRDVCVASQIASDTKPDEKPKKS